MLFCKKNFLFTFLFLLTTHLGWSQLTFFVSIKGNDQQGGSFESPFNTIKHALNVAQGYPGQVIKIQLRAGTYYLDSTIIIDAANINTASLTIEPFNKEQVFISAGQKLNLQWKPYKNGICQATVPENCSFERLYVNGVLQTMARFPNYNPEVRIFHGYAASAIAPAKVKAWQNPAGAYIHALQANEWGSVHYEIQRADKDGQLVLKGGWQMNRDAAMHKEYRFVENVFEELDTTAEWFLDKKAHTLYFYPAKTLDLQKATIEVSQLKNSIVLQGTARQPLKNVRLTGLNFIHNERSFMDTKEPLLRSDWKIYRGGALLLTGTERCKITRCHFDFIGGNAITLSNYNNLDTISNCLISHIGASGILLVGNPSAVRSPIFDYAGFIPFRELDKTPGPQGNDFPRHCLVADNLIHDIGTIEKQVAGVDIDMASTITVSHNSIYNTPRAGINIGSGCWGGHNVEYNDVFNTVLETGDHGAFNSWGRDRFWNSHRNYTDSLTAVHPDLILLDVQQPNVIHDNRFRCDHGWDIDLDDGSSNYHIYNNVCLSGGLKLREGFYRIVENNIIINNSFHPHVWFKNSRDVFKHNIVMKKYFPIGMHYWGKIIDSNLFFNKADLIQAKANGTDSHSLFGNALFINPAIGLYTVQSQSPAFKIDFVNFSMTQFGVQDPELKKLAQTPIFPALQFSVKADSTPAITTFLGGEIKSVAGLGDRSAFGLPDETGIIVLSVGDQSILSRSGLQAQDVICSANNQKMENTQAFIDLVQASKWKSKIPIEIIRNQKRIKTYLLLK